MSAAKLSTENLGERLDRLESHAAIRELTYNYCHGFDKRDWELFLSIWWQDCIWNIGPPFGSFAGHAGIHNAVHEVLWPAWHESHHLSANHVISFDDPDHGHCVCDVDCVGRLSGEVDCQIVGATYSDTLQRRKGVWKILRRDVQIHYFNSVPGTVLAAPAQT